MLGALGIYPPFDTPAGFQLRLDGQPLALHRPWPACCASVGDPVPQLLRAGVHLYALYHEPTGLVAYRLTEGEPYHLSDAELQALGVGG